MTLETIEVVNSITDAIRQMGGKDVARWYNKIVDAPEIVYVGDGVYSETHGRKPNEA